MLSFWVKTECSWQILDFWDENRFLRKPSKFWAKFLFSRQKLDQAVYKGFFFQVISELLFPVHFFSKKLKTCRRKSRKIWNETFWVFVNSVRICNRRDQKGFGGPFSSRPDSDSVSLEPHYATILLKKNVSQVSKTNSRIRKFLIICSYGMILF